MEGKKRRQNNVWLKKEGEQKMLIKGNLAVVERGHVKKGCTDSAAKALLVLDRAGGLSGHGRDDRKGTCLLWDREDLIYAVKGMR